MIIVKITKNELKKKKLKLRKIVWTEPSINKIEFYVLFDLLYYTST